jgi:hypothetical protein
MRRVAVVALWVVFVLCGGGRADSRYLLEVEGMVNMLAVEGNIYAYATEQVGLNVLPSWNMALGGQQSYRNHGVDVSGFISTGYRLRWNALAVPMAALGGVRILRVGSYRTAVPLAGIEMGLFYWVNEGVSVRAKYRFCAHFDDLTVFSHAVLIGLGYSFLAHKE